MCIIAAVGRQFFAVFDDQFRVRCRPGPSEQFCNRNFFIFFPVNKTTTVKGISRAARTVYLPTPRDCCQSIYTNTYYLLGFFVFEPRRVYLLWYNRTCTATTEPEKGEQRQIAAFRRYPVSEKPVASWRSRVRWTSDDLPFVRQMLTSVTHTCAALGPVYCIGRSLSFFFIIL